MIYWCPSRILVSRHLKSPTCSFDLGSIDILVIDSVVALTPRAEIEGDMVIRMSDFRLAS